MPNGFPFGQCTWWANEYYHTLTGSYITWGGNANQWTAGAAAAGWHVSSTPPKGIPSIMILQAGVQGADPTYGHVGVVTGVNGDGSANVSNMNWHAGPVLQHVNGVPITQSTIRPGTGVSFAWKDGSAVSSDSSVATSATPTADGGGATANSTDWQTQIAREGQKVGLFALAFVLVAFGFYVLFKEQIDGAVKSGAGIAEKAAVL